MYVKWTEPGSRIARLFVDGRNVFDFSVNPGQKRVEVFLYDPYWKLIPRAKRLRNGQPSQTKFDLVKLAVEY